MTKYIANILTGCRIFGSFLLLFFPVFSPDFYITYILCGFSDMTDGMIARKTNSTSAFGSRLDTIADLIFVVASLFKLMPAMHLPQWLWIWGGVIAIMKLASIIWGFVRIKKLVAYHSVFNKITGLQCFLLPFTLQFIEPTYSFAVVCIIATIAAVQEACYTMS